jgi:hypothetical protein
MIGHLLSPGEQKLEEQVHHLNGKGGEQASAGKAATHLGDEPKRQEKYVRGQTTSATSRKAVHGQKA